MRQVSESELKRLRKKGTVRKKMGAQPEKERPEPVADDDKGMSGSVPPEQPAPVLTSESEREIPPGMVETSRDKDHTHLVPYAAMAVSNDARDAAFDDLVATNKKVIEDFTVELKEQRANVRKRVPWDHDLIRDDKTGLLKKIRSTPLES